ncbi:TPA: phage tail tape measure protein [Morganella morganii subsp. morganii]|uniref:phage tail tape measure protein n=1 Tax=Morganella morganii TaxID=582 RepID=UPI00104693D0|nr:phage tail tape measure protein [Morganella morganii]EKW8485168.1 phage tail tape measure protein [Morganella morganii]ELA7677967.1 phage tail tape measure protein [Morganella morganii]MBT0509806.1 phage tail tape measure protein [Morganella morganii subsp. morganii]MDU2633393.1 phage tail tape measure protein [Morganella morganii]QUI28735.1 phage tail tape measure protein [Morganella morganii]
MSQQIADLVINLSADSTTFTEQVGRVERQLLQAAASADASAERMRKFAEGQSAAVNQAANSTQATLKTLDESQIFSADKFVQKWKAAAREIDSMHRRMNEQLNNSRQKDSAGRDLARQQDAMTESFFRQIDAVKKTGSGLEQLAVIQSKLNQAQRAGTISQQDYLTLISSVTQRTTELRRADENLTQQKTRFIQRLKEQVATRNLSRKEMLRYQAAQLGVSSSADIYINKLRDSNKETEKFKGNNKILSEGLRSLAGHMGMSKFTYFGGMGAVVGGIAAVGKAAWNAEQEVTLLNRQLIATGNYAGKTSAQLRLMADQMSGGWITRSDMTAALTSAVGSGYFFGDQVSLVAKAAAQMKQATGQSVDETVNQFKRLKDDPVNAIMEMDKSMHLLTASEYEHIAALERSGKTREASEYAITKLAEVTNRRTIEMSEDVGILERSWNNLTKGIKEAGDELSKIWRPQTEAEKLVNVRENIVSLENEWKTESARQSGLKTLRANESELEFIVKSQQGYLDNKNKIIQANEWEKKTQQDLNKYIEAGLSQAEKRTREHEKLNREIAANAKAAKDTASASDSEKIRLWTQDEIAKARAGIDKKYADPKAPNKRDYRIDEGTKAEETALKEQIALESKLRVLKEHKSVTDVISAERKKLWETEAQIAITEEARGKRQLTKQEQALLANKAAVLAQHEKLALLGDEVVAQERLNKLQDQADKYIKQQIEKRNAIRDSIGKSSREVQKSLEIAQLNSAYEGTLDHGRVLADLEKNYAAEEEKRADWLGGAQTAWGDYRDAALDSNAQIQNATMAALNGFSTELTSVLTTGKANFREFTTSILKMLTEIFVKKSIVMGMDAMGFNFTPNAKGGVYSSPSLSAYSGQVVHTPTMFAFAKGAGVMGEAGPEGIFPLRRGLDGKLGVVAKMAGGGGEPLIQNNYFTINNDGSNGQMGPQATQTILKLVEQKTKQVLASERRPGGAMG